MIYKSRVRTVKLAVAYISHLFGCGRCPHPTWMRDTSCTCCHSFWWILLFVRKTELGWSASNRTWTRRSNIATGQLSHHHIPSENEYKKSKFKKRHHIDLLFEIVLKDIVVWSVQAGKTRNKCKYVYSRAQKCIQNFKYMGVP